MEEMQEVPGMAKFYKTLEEEGVAFHYVTGAPFKIWNVLKEFLQKFSFPKGTINMRNLKIGGDSTVAHKTRVINQLLKQFPQKKFILIGDAGEKDIYTYRGIVTNHNDRIAKIFIRQVANKKSVSELQNMAGIKADNQKWVFFNDKDIPHLYDKLKEKSDESLNVQSSLIEEDFNDRSDDDFIKEIKNFEIEVDNS